MTDTSGVVPPEPEEPMYAQLGEEGDPFEVNPPLPDQGQYDGEHGEGLDEPEEQAGVGA
jgi:hypothetical protein